MSTFFGRFLFALAVSGLSAAAWAQTEPEAPVGSRVKRDPEKARVAETRATLAGYGRCVVKRAYGKAAEYVLDTSSLDFDSKRYGELTSPDCLVHAAVINNYAIALKMPGDMLRFALADALAARDLADFDPSKIKTAQALVFPTIDPAAFAPKPGKYSAKNLAKLEEDKVMAQGRIAFWRYGDCVVRTDPHGARTLLRSEPTSGETAAFQALMPALSSCLMKGEQFKSNRTMLRGTIALSYYRLAKAPEIQPPQGTSR